MGGVGRAAGGSREKRFVVATVRPASWRDRMRSAILPPDLFSVPFVLELGVRVMVNGRRKMVTHVEDDGVFDCSNASNFAVNPSTRSFKLFPSCCSIFFSTIKKKFPCK
jgi:hypothetical protein